MQFPVEILENILIHCDGRTLLNAGKIHADWQNIVEYLSKKTRIWEWCCREEIPEKELIDYLEKYYETDKRRDKFRTIYHNWLAWENLENIKCDIVLSPVEIPRISCIAVSSKYIATGTEDGRLRLFNKHWDNIYVARHTAVRIQTVTFIHNTKPEEDGTICVLSSFNRNINIMCFDGHQKDELTITDVKSHSVYKNYICYEQLGGRLTISKLVSVNGHHQLAEIRFSRIYSPSSISCLNLWNGVCTILINNEVRILSYGNEGEAVSPSPVDKFQRKNRIKFSFDSNGCKSRIIRNDVIISLYKSKIGSDSDFIEFFIFDQNNKCSQKLFNTWEIFCCIITCIYVYGNTLILGVDIGNVYLYHVSSWKTLDLREYDKKIVIGKHPIISIDVQESHNERKFYISSKFNIHELIGFAPNFYKALEINA